MIWPPVRRGFSAAFILVTYFFIRFALVKHLDAFGDYGSYFFEVIFICGVSFYYRERLNFFKFSPKALARGPLPGLALGFLAYMIAKPLELPVPFDLRAVESVVMLLIVGPIVEEMLFRFCLWEPVFDLTGSVRSCLVSSVLFFSFAHFFAFWFTPEPVHAFIIYQTIYVVPLAILCGMKRIKTCSMTLPIIIHVCFNLGFLLASFV